MVLEVFGPLLFLFVVSICLIFLIGILQLIFNPSARKEVTNLFSYLGEIVHDFFLYLSYMKYKKSEAKNAWKKGRHTV